MADQPPPSKRLKETHEYDETLNDNKELTDSDTLMPAGLEEEQSHGTAEVEAVVAREEETEEEKKEREAKEEQAVARKHDDGQFRVHAQEWELRRVRPNYGITIPRLTIFVEDHLALKSVQTRDEKGDATVPKKKLIQLAAHEHEAFKALRAAAGKQVSDGRPKKSEARGRLFDRNREQQDKAFLERLADQEKTYSKREARSLLDGARVSASGIVSLLNGKANKKKSASKKTTASENDRKRKEKVSFSGLEYFYETATFTDSMREPGGGAAASTVVRPLGSSATTKNAALSSNIGRIGKNQYSTPEGSAGRPGEQTGILERRESLPGSIEGPVTGNTSSSFSARTHIVAGANRSQGERSRERRRRGGRRRRDWGRGNQGGENQVAATQSSVFSPPEGAPAGTTEGDLYMEGYNLGLGHGMANEIPGPPPRTRFLLNGSWDLFDLGWNQGNARGRLDATSRAPANFMGRGGASRDFTPRSGGGMGGSGRSMGSRDADNWQIYTAADFEGDGEDEEEVEKPPKRPVHRFIYPEHRNRGRISNAKESSAFEQGLQEARESFSGPGAQSAIPDAPARFSLQLGIEWTEGYTSGRQSMQTLIEKEMKEAVEEHNHSERKAAREREVARVLTQDSDTFMDDPDAEEPGDDHDKNAEDHAGQESDNEHKTSPDPSEAQVVQNLAPSLEITPTTPQTNLNNTSSSVLSDAFTPTPVVIPAQDVVERVPRLVSVLPAPPVAVDHTNRASSHNASLVSNVPITAPALLPIPPHNHTAPGFFPTQAWIRGWNQGELAGRRNLPNRRPELQCEGMDMSAEDRIAYIEGFGAVHILEQNAVLSDQGDGTARQESTGIPDWGRLVQSASIRARFAAATRNTNGELLESASVCDVIFSERAGNHALVQYPR
ncbi:unnamed protein product [Diplocarpon coronariae]